MAEGLAPDDVGVDVEDGLLMLGEVTEVLLVLPLRRASSEKSVLMFVCLRLDNSCSSTE